MTDDERANAAKSRLAELLPAFLQSAGWTRAEAAEKMETSEAILSEIIAGRVEAVPLATILSGLSAFGEVEIRIRPMHVAITW